MSVDLRPVRYQFPEPAKHEWNNLNWLVIAGNIESPEGRWSFEDPCLQTLEAIRLGGWLREAAGGDVEPSTPNADGTVWPALYFTEPNLAFGVEVHEAGDVILRVHFSLESAPPWSGEERRVSTSQFFVRCWLSEEAVHLAAAQWLDEVSEFPERGARDW